MAIKIGPFIRGRIIAERQTALDLRKEASDLEREAALRRQQADECDRKADWWAEGTDAR